MDTLVWDDRWNAKLERLWLERLGVNMNKKCDATGDKFQETGVCREGVAHAHRSFRGAVAD